VTNLPDGYNLWPSNVWEYPKRATNIHIVPPGAIWFSPALCGFAPRAGWDSSLVFEDATCPKCVRRLPAERERLRHMSADELAETRLMQDRGTTPR
jgi:hypothetical protein